MKDKEKKNNTVNELPSPMTQNDSHSRLHLHNFEIKVTQIRNQLEH